MSTKSCSVNFALALAAIFCLAAASNCFAANYVVEVGPSGTARFDPSNISINVGDSVTFHMGAADHGHNVHANDGSFRCAQGCDGDGKGGNGNPSKQPWSNTITFNTPGVVDYVCDPHIQYGMVGSITVNAVTSAPAITLGGYMSGAWAITGQGGQGFQIEFTNAPGATSALKMALAIWFAYTPDGSNANNGSGQNWIYSQGDYDPTSNSVTLPAILLAGARFPPNFNSADVHRVPSDSSLWGHLTFAFTDCNNGSVSWHSDLPGYNGLNDTPQPIQRLTQIDGTACPAP